MRLLESGCRPRLFFSNSNIDSAEEFERRLENLKIVSRHFGIDEPLADPYRHDEWLSHVSQLEGYGAFPEGGERCRRCFEWNLRRTAEAAQKLNAVFATTLTVSPHKRSPLIFEVGGGISPDFLPFDFKKRDGFLNSIRLAKELGLYRQSYCGCEFSKAAANKNTPSSS